jgi:NADH dehydrogenase
LICSGAHVLPELSQHHQPLVTWAEGFLATSGVDIRVNTKVSAATPEEVVLSTGERIPSRTLISCSGTSASPLLDGLGVERDERGRVKVDENLRVLGRTNVWAGGDCAAVPHPKGGSCPQLAIYAETAGSKIAANVIATVEGSNPKPYRFTGFGDACSLGRRNAVGHVLGVRLTGFVAWVAWRMTLLKFVPTWDRRVRLVIDWILWPIFGRDVVNIRMDDTAGMQRQHYEPGQEIVREGEIGRRLYIIFDGEVEVFSAGSGSEVLATLSRGQHFGEAAVFQNVRRTASVRARTRVDVLSIGQTDSIALSVMKSFGDAINKLPATALPPA